MLVGVLLRVPAPSVIPCVRQQHGPPRLLRHHPSQAKPVPGVAQHPVADHDRAMVLQRKTIILTYFCITINSITHLLRGRLPWLDLLVVEIDR